MSLIKECDVIRMKLPYPNIESSLALQAHMYICKCADYPQFEFIKCQTLKPYMLINNPLKHFCDEKADITRNPFVKTTRIDCDKVISTQTLDYPEALLTSRRRDICCDLYNTVITELKADGYKSIVPDETVMFSINSEIVYA